MLKKEVVLALDVATHCGWCLSDSCYGVWDLSPKRDESAGMRVIRFKSKLKTIFEAEPVSLIVYERPGGMFKGAIIVEAELIGVLKLMCEENNIAYKAYSATEIKKHATGKGNANKKLMIEHAKLKYGYAGENDNEADAIHLFHLAIDDLKLE